MRPPFYLFESCKIIIHFIRNSLLFRPHIFLVAPTNRIAAQKGGGGDKKYPGYEYRMQYRIGYSIIISAR